jgi:hypothetical protein
MGKSDGQQSSFDHMEDYLRSLLEQKETVSVVEPEPESAVS